MSNHPGINAWQELAGKQLRGRPLEDLNWKTRALVRRRKIDSPATLLRVLLIHLAGGKSLRTTAAYAREANLCQINDVTLLHRIRCSGHRGSSCVAASMHKPQLSVLQRNIEFV